MTYIRELPSTRAASDWGEVRVRDRGRRPGAATKGNAPARVPAVLPVFQGGAMPLVRRVPKRGFHNKFAPHRRDRQRRGLGARPIAAGDEVNLETLREKSLVKGVFDLLKVLGHGPLTKKLRVAAHRFSKTAEASIRQAGGEVVVLPGKTLVADKVDRKT